MKTRARGWLSAIAALAVVAGGITAAVAITEGHETRGSAGPAASARLVGLGDSADAVTPVAELSPANDFATAAAIATPGVVEVNVVDTRSGSAGLGSGVLVARNRDTVWVLTNAHVTAEADRIQVVLSDQRAFDATLVGADTDTDLALLAFRTREPVSLAVLGDSDGLRVGDWVIAVGNPLGFESSVTAGIVSALGRHVERESGVAALPAYIQTDASINSGNSGGALVNLRGEVVGISTWIASETGESIGIGFAIPINTVRDTLSRLLRDAGTRPTV